jgi:hypothetical protein
MTATMVRVTERTSGVPAVVGDLVTLMNIELETITALAAYKRDAIRAEDGATADLFGQIERRMREDVGKLQELLFQHHQASVVPPDFVMPHCDDEVDD